MKKITTLLLILLSSAAALFAQDIHPRWLKAPEAEQLLVHDGFTISYNDITLCPNWSAWTLTPAEAAADEVGRTDFFTTDPLVTGRQAEYRDYSRNAHALDRGHMAPSADFKWSKQANAETFYLTNICPQDHALNEGLWLELEQRCRAWAKHYNADIHIVCGPLFKETLRTIGANAVSVPSAFFKTIMMTMEGKRYAIAFVMPNSALDVQDDIFEYAVSMDELKELTGLDPFPGWRGKASFKAFPWDIPWKKPKKKV